MQYQGKEFKIGVLGGNGLLGSDLVKFLGKKFNVISITKETYKQEKDKYFDCLINANGNSKRFWAKEHPLEDFLASTLSVYESIFDFPCKLYIYISSSDVYENHMAPKYTKENSLINASNLEPYGFNKYLSELIVKKYKEEFLILRLSMVLGKNLKKGPIFDIMHDKPIFVTCRTRLQLVTSLAISEIIVTLLKKKVVNGIINVGGEGTYDFGKMEEHFKKKIQILPEAQTQIYDMNVEKIKGLYKRLKTSEEYLKEFLRDLY